jgi:hypothetical protein
MFDDHVWSFSIRTTPGNHAPFLPYELNVELPDIIIASPVEFRRMKWDTSKRLEPIVLVFAERRERRVVRTAREAAEVLLRDWPAEEGEEFLVAVKTCLDVITGKAEPENLHQAIVRAAYEAGIAAITTDHRLGVVRMYPRPHIASVM